MNLPVLYIASPADTIAPAIFPTTGIASAPRLKAEEAISAAVILLTSSVNRLVTQPAKVSGE